MEEKKIDEMNERELLAELLRQQKTSAKSGRILVGILAVIAVVAILAAALLVPRAIRTLNEAQELIEEGQTALAGVEEMVGGIEEITGNVDGLVTDVSGLVSGVNGIVTENTEAVTEAIGKINDIDFESLNKSIQDLSDILEPLANFFNLFPH